MHVTLKTISDLLKDLRSKSEVVEINVLFMILEISVSNLCLLYESHWSIFFFSLAVIFSKFLDGIKEKAHKHQTM